VSFWSSGCWSRLRSDRRAEEIEDAGLRPATTVFRERDPLPAPVWTLTVRVYTKDPADFLTSERARYPLPNAAVEIGPVYSGGTTSWTSLARTGSEGEFWFLYQQYYYVHDDYYGRDELVDYHDWRRFAGPFRTRDDLRDWKEDNAPTRSGLRGGYDYRELSRHTWFDPDTSWQ